LLSHKKNGHELLTLLCTFPPEARDVAEPLVELALESTSCDIDPVVNMRILNGLAGELEERLFFLRLTMPYDSDSLHEFENNTSTLVTTVRGLLDEAPGNQVKMELTK
jgi:hypothetical protein